MIRLPTSNIRLETWKSVQQRESCSGGAGWNVAGPRLRYATVHRPIACRHRPSLSPPSYPGGPLFLAPTRTARTLNTHGADSRRFQPQSANRTLTAACHSRGHYHLLRTRCGSRSAGFTPRLRIRASVACSSGGDFGRGLARAHRRPAPEVAALIAQLKRAGHPAYVSLEPCAITPDAAVPML